MLCNEMTYRLYIYLSTETREGTRGSRLIHCETERRRCQGAGSLDTYDLNLIGYAMYDIYMDIYIDRRGKAPDKVDDRTAQMSRSIYTYVT